MAYNTVMSARLDWCKLLNEIENKDCIFNLSNALSALYEIGSELVKNHKENQELKHQLEHPRCAELKKTIEEKNSKLEALGSSVVKLEENRNVDKFVQEAYRIFSNDYITLTPPPESNKFPNNITPPSNSSNSSQKDLRPVQTPAKINKTDALKQNKKEIKQGNDNLIKVVVKEEKDSPEYEAGEKVISMNNSSDISITDESMGEIHPTPKGRTSPIIGISKSKSKTLPRGVLTFQISGSHKAKRALKGKNGYKNYKQTTLSLAKPARKVNLSDLAEFGGGVRSREVLPTPKVAAIRAFVEDDDVIQPSPTSETITATLHSKLHLGSLPQSRTACGVTSPPPSAVPPPPSSCPTVSQDAADALSGGIDFDELMETDSLDASMDLLQRHRDMTHTQLSPVLNEIINSSKNDNTPVKNDKTPKKKDKTPIKTEKTPVKATAATQFDTDISVSVLRQPFVRTRAERENLAPKEEKKCRAPHGPKSKQIKKESPRKQSPEKHAGASASLLTNYQVQIEVVDKKINLRKNYAHKKGDAAEPAFPYKEKTARKKADKLKLPGWSCEDCKHYYADVSDPARIALLMERCSRHRAAHDPARPRTPPGFWNHHFTVPEDSEQLNRLNNAI